MYSIECHLPPPSPLFSHHKLWVAVESGKYFDYITQTRTTLAIAFGVAKDERDFKKTVGAYMWGPRNIRSEWHVVQHRVEPHGNER